MSRGPCHAVGGRRSNTPQHCARSTTPRYIQAGAAATAKIVASCVGWEKMSKKTPSPDPRQSKAFRELENAVALERFGKIEQADSAYANVVRKHHDYFDALHIYGLFKFKIGQLQAAVKLIEKATKVNPRSMNSLKGTSKNREE